MCFGSPEWGEGFHCLGIIVRPFPSISDLCSVATFRAGLSEATSASADNGTAFLNCLTTLHQSQTTFCDDCTYWSRWEQIFKAYKGHGGMASSPWHYVKAIVIAKLGWINIRRIVASAQDLRGQWPHANLFMSNTQSWIRWHLLQIRCSGGFVSFEPVVNAGGHPCPGTSYTPHSYRVFTAPNGRTNECSLIATYVLMVFYRRTLEFAAWSRRWTPLVSHEFL